MHRTVAGEFERFTVSCIGNHGRGVTAYKHRLTCEEAMMVVKVKVVRIPRYFAVIVDNLSVILADILQIVKFKRPDCP